MGNGIWAISRIEVDTDTRIDMGRRGLGTKIATASEVTCIAAAKPQDHAGINA